MQLMSSGHSRQTVIVVCAVLLLALAVAATAALTLFNSTNTEAATDGAAMSLRVDAAQTIGCAGGPPGKVCVNVNQKFDVFVVADAVPPNGYIVAVAWIDYDSQGLVHKKNTVVIWPDCGPAKFLPAQNAAKNSAYASCLTGLLPPQPRSTYKGDLYSFSLTCTATQSSSQIGLIPFGQAPADADGALYVEWGTGNAIIPSVTGIQVNCVAPTPTPTDTPTPTLTVTPTPTATPTPAPDADGDGCSDLQEMGPDARLGGQRDYLNPHDFYDAAGSPDPPQNGAPDGTIDLPNDILGVILHHPAADLGYDVQFDRGSWTGPNSWNETQGPDGVIDLPNDILGVILQFNHSCR